MLLAAREITHLVDVLPSSCVAVVHYGAVICFCARLLTIEYMDLVEQKLIKRSIDSSALDFSRYCDTFFEASSDDSDACGRATSKCETRDEEWVCSMSSHKDVSCRASKEDTCPKTTLATLILLICNAAAMEAPERKTEE